MLLRFFLRVLRAFVTIEIARYDHRAWSCTRKVRHSDEADAVRATLAQSKRRRLGQYACAYCGGWHLYSIHDPGLTPASSPSKSRP